MYMYIVYAQVYTCKVFTCTCVHLRKCTSGGWDSKKVHCLWYMYMRSNSYTHIQHVIHILYITCIIYTCFSDHKHNSVPTCTCTCTSEQRNSLMEERSTFLPSANLEYGVFPDPFSCSSHLSPPATTTSPR